MIHASKLARGALVALVLGFCTMLLTSAYGTVFGSAYGRTQWSAVVDNGGIAARCTRYESLTKSIFYWARLPDSERHQASQPTRPLSDVPTWALFRSVQKPRSGAMERHEIAVGWPLRTLRCVHVRQDDYQDGIPLRMLIENRGKVAFGELRAIPLRPIWLGIAVNIGLFTLVWLVVLYTVRWSPRRRHWRTFVHWRLRRRTALTGALCGCLSVIVVAFLLPAILRQRSYTLGTGARASTFATYDQWWTVYRTTLIDDELSRDTSVRVANVLPTLRYADGAGSQLPSSVAPVYLVVIRTGWPLRCFEGYRRLHSGGELDRSRLLDVPASGAQHRGLSHLPLQPLPLRIAFNFLFWTAVWVGVLWGVGLLLQGRRTSLGHCSQCGYDLAGIAGPCPECGSQPVR